MHFHIIIRIIRKGISDVIKHNQDDLSQSSI